MPRQPFVVATHGHCFDGMASAVFFSQMLQSLEPNAHDISFQGQSYEPGTNGVTIVGNPEGVAILDFRFTKLPNLRWFFDHHASAFPDESCRQRFAALADSNRGFFAPTYGSCTRLIREVARDRFGLPFAHLESLFSWAEMIDSAKFASPEMAVARDEPVMRLLTLIEQRGDDSLLANLVGRFETLSLEEVANLPEIVERANPCVQKHHAQVGVIRERETKIGDVVFVDLLDIETDSLVKFVTYADVPSAPYSVMVSRNASRCKISVGYNPWGEKPRRHEINQICERFGGGGHAVVGAIALPSDVARAREIAEEIVRALNS
jgi:hypothetical protein